MLDDWSPELMDLGNFEGLALALALVTVLDW